MNTEERRQMELVRWRTSIEVWLKVCAYNLLSISVLLALIFWRLL